MYMDEVWYLDTTVLALSLLIWFTRTLHEDYSDLNVFSQKCTRHCRELNCLTPPATESRFPEI